MLLAANVVAMADWTDAENDQIVADYFAMLAKDISGQAYSKAEHNRGLQQRIGRPRGSIEYKHQNISAVLKGLGEVWLDGYKPAFNFQGALIDAVARWLGRNGAWLDRAPRAANLFRGSMQEDSTLWIGPPPTQSNAPEPKELALMNAIARRFDVAERDARNRALGRAGEARVVAHEKASLSAFGRIDLADKVRWVSDQDGDGAGYDIASYLPDGRDRLIEVKTTNGWERTPFHISRNELDVADRLRDSWNLVRLYDFSRQPRAFEIRPPLDSHVALTPTSFLATPR